MENYLGTFPVKLKDTPFAAFTSAHWVLYYIERYGGIDGALHKQWLIDQIARILNGGPVNVVEARWGGGHTEYRVNVSSCDQYTAWVTKMKAGEDGPAWDKGTPP